MSFIEIINKLEVGKYQTIKTNKADAKKITHALLTKGWWFLFYRHEGDYYISMSSSVDLNFFNKRGYVFEIG